MKVKCPFCGIELDAPEGTEGQTAECPTCKKTFQIQAQAPIKLTEVKPVEQASLKKCPYCKKDVEPDATTCPHCHHSFYSTNPAANFIIGIVVFVILYFIISQFVSCEGKREYEKIKKDAEKETQQIMRDAEREAERMMKKNGY